MLRFIDISNHQGREGINLPSILPNVNAVICKATEGIGFVDAYCDRFIQQIKAADKPWGFYHFANLNDPLGEAEFFMEHCWNYFGEGIPVLDWEGVTKNGKTTWQTVDWVNRFVRHVHERTGIWPWIYANPWLFNQGGVEKNCGRWAAQYPNIVRPSINHDPGKPPSVDGLLCAWQFASDGVVGGYSGNLDVDIFYGNREAWNK